jgi:Mce-associated membrane protein
MTVKQRSVRRPKVAGHNRRSAPATTADEVIVDEVPDETVADDEVSNEVSSGEEPIEDEADAPPRRTRLPLALILAAALLVGLGSFFLVKANSVDSAVDTRGMTEVNGQVKDAVEKIFSFSYDKVDAASSAARQVLAGTAIGEYDKLIAQVSAQAPSQKLVLATRVTSIGVKSLDGDHAELLVFLDQVATRVDTNKSSGSAAALSVKAERQNGIWKITNLTPR